MIFSKDFPDRADAYMDDIGEETVTLPEPVHVEKVLPREFRDKIGTKVLSPKPIGLFYNASIVKPAGLGVTTGGDYIMDTAFVGRLDVLERNAPYLYWSNHALSEPPKELETPVCSLVSVWSGNYFHWVAELLPRLRAVEHYQFVQSDDVVVLVEANPPKFVAESLELLGIRHLRTTEPHYSSPCLVVPAACRERGRASPAAIQWMRDQVRDTVAGESGGSALAGSFGRRLYISRERSSERRVIDEDRLLGELSPYGFEKIRPEEHSFLDQVRIFSQCDVIVAPHGGGSTNAIWGESTGLVELFSPRYINPCAFTLIHAAHGGGEKGIMGEPEETRYGFVMGEARNRDIVVDPLKVLAVLEAMNVLD